jgi:hypothetical protein
LPIPGCQRLTKPDLSYDQADDGQTERDDPDSEDAASAGVCFHGPTLSRAKTRVLIERNHSAIDRSDEGEKRCQLPPCMELRVTGPASPDAQLQPPHGENASLRLWRTESHGHHISRRVALQLPVLVVMVPPVAKLYSLAEVRTE